MVKNSSVNQPTDQVRLGIHANSEQPANSIVFNASKEKLTHVKNSGLYVAPIRADEGSNLLAYNSLTKEIVDIGGQKLKLKHLEVENLEVENKTIKNEKFKLYPILDIAENSSNKETGITIHNDKGEVNILNDQGKIKIDSDLDVGGKIKALLLEGDGGLLSNLQIQTEVRQHFDNIYVRNELHADGQYLRNIKKSQIIDFENNSHAFDELVVSSLDIKKSVHADGDIYCTKLYGDGSNITGIPKIDYVEKIKNSIDARVNTIHDDFSSVVKLIQTQIDDNVDYISKLKPVKDDVKHLNSKMTEIDTIKTDLKAIHDLCDSYKRAIVHNEGVVESQEKNINEINEILETFADKSEYHDLKSEVLTQNDKIDDVSTTVLKSLENLNNFFSRVEELDKDKVKYINRDEYGCLKSDVALHKKKIECIIEDVIVKHEQSNEYYTKTRSIENRLNGLVERVDADKDLNISFSKKVENDMELSKRMFEDNKRWLGLHENRVRDLENAKTLKSIPNAINVDGNLAKTSRLGEIEALSVSARYGKLADICGFTKANNGTTSGNPGGLLFRTMNPQGSLTNAMTLDANGKATIGMPTKNDRNPPAILALNSTTFGFLPPRMTTEEREHIPNPVPGLVVFDTTSESLCFYKSTGWLCLS